MFGAHSTPRVYAIPPGVDFGSALIDGLLGRCKNMPPEALAKVEIVVNTRRMQRRLRDLFDEGPARLLPRIRLVTDFSDAPIAADLPLPSPALRRRLELASLVAGLLDAQPDLAPRSALFALTDSLAGLLEEMQGEGVSPDVIEALDVTDQSGHWQRSLAFMTIVRSFSGDAYAPSAEARQRAAIERLADKWQTMPPQHPIIVAGTTGSRGSTALLMEAVAKLPNGALVLPGFDTAAPDKVWSELARAKGPEDHPQYRFVRLLDALGLSRNSVRLWVQSEPASPSRNALISLALRPAPVTDQWRADGPMLGDLGPATKGLTLLEAPDPRAEAEAIALGIRALVGEGKRTALITPDRQLTRQVTAELARWGLDPDDSAGTPLHLTPPGRLLRQIGACFGIPVTSEALLALLKHPLVSGASGRGDHLRLTHDLELYIRRKGAAFPTTHTLASFAKGPRAIEWAAWLGPLIDRLSGLDASPLSHHIDHHIALAEALALGPNPTVPSPLWAEAAGRKAREVMADLERHADACMDLDSVDYANLVSSILRSAEVRNPDVGHPLALIWGTLEARVQGADVTILAGLNEGTWPETPNPDPWLNRRMRQMAGLLLPERKIGLSAHDFQQAVAGSEVWITRALFAGDAATVPSRWINRLENLLNGLTDQNGPDALRAMRARGRVWLDQAARLEMPADVIPPEPRPSPRPPVADRPKKMSVTQIKTLIRDPYAIYARDILGLRELNSLSPSADAPLKGIILHRVMERFIFDGPDIHDAAAVQTLVAIAREELDAQCPWPTIRHLWLARFSAIAGELVKKERLRQTKATPRLREDKASIHIPEIDLMLTGRADRVDITPEGAAILYDYKSGTLPTKPQQEKFDKQLLIQAAMLERGAFDKLGRVTAAGAAFIGIGADTRETPAPFENSTPAETWDGFVQLMQKWRQADRGYSARLAPFVDSYSGPYDHLSRFGEWEMIDPAAPEDLE